MDLFARTWESLDFGVVLERLSAECRTEMGRVRALVPDFKTTLEEVRKEVTDLVACMSWGGLDRWSESGPFEPEAIRCGCVFSLESASPPVLLARRDEVWGMLTCDKLGEVQVPHRKVESRAEF